MLPRVSKAPKPQNNQWGRTFHNQKEKDKDPTINMIAKIIIIELIRVSFFIPYKKE